MMQVVSQTLAAAAAAAAATAAAAEQTVDNLKIREGCFHPGGA